MRYNNYSGDNMKCEKCGKHFNTGKFCPDCGKELIKEKVKFSGVTIISLIILILIIVASIGLIVYAMIEANVSGNDAYGWLIFIVLMVAFLVIPYYLVIFRASVICDRKIKNKKLIKNIILVFFLLLPFLWLEKKYIDSKIDSERLSYQYEDMSIAFPEGMNRISTSTDFDGKYSMVEFYKDDCSIEWGVSNYNNDLSLINNFKNNSDRFTIIDNNRDTIYEDFNLSYNLRNENINGKLWNLYEKDYINLNYKLYGIKINDNFYKIEVKNKNSNICNNLLKQVLSTIKYK